MQARLKASTPRVLVGSALLVGLSLGAAARVQATDSRASSARPSVSRGTGGSLVGTLEESFPALSPRLKLSSSFEDVTWRHGKQRVEGLRARRQTSPDGSDRGEAVDVVFPARASGPVVAEGEGVRVILRPRGARPVRARVIDGKLAYLDVYPETDSLHLIDHNRTEEYLYLRSARAPVRFEYDVLETDGASSVQIEQGQVHFRTSDDQGLVILAPVVIDAAGRRSATAARWELENEGELDARRLILHFEPAGLEYPLLIDPTWITTNSLNAARPEGIGILLQNGKVLVMGRDPQAELYDIATGTWSVTGPGWSGYAASAAVLLPDGRVLVTGGYTSVPTLTIFSDCFLYDPISNTWSAAPNMQAARRNHTATLLLDGKVLVTGGENTAATINTSEIYDPAANMWEPLQTLAAGGKAKHTATLLRGAPVEGHVMVTGGVTSVNTQTPITEIYNPGTGVWTRVADLNPPRSQHTATLLRDGKVLAVGGVIIPFGPLADVYDPVANTWTLLAPLPSSPRYDHTATLLPSGRLLLVGGTSPVPLNTAEIFYPAGDPGPPAGPAWVAAPNMDTVRYLHSATMLPDGRVLVVGGFDGGGPLATARLLDVDEPRFTDHNAMTVVRSEHTMTPLADGRLLVAGGSGPNPDTGEVYDPGPQNWTPIVPLMTQARWRHTATRLMDGRVLLAGSISGATAAQSAEVYEPGGNTFTAVGSMGDERNSHTATLLPCGEVLVAGGETMGGTDLQTAERFNPRTKAWTPTTPMGTPRQRHTATLLLDGRVLVTGGRDGGAVHNTAEIYDPSALPVPTWTPTGNMTAAREYHRATLLPNGLVLVVGGLGSANTAEIFDPSGGGGVGTFSTIPGPTAPHDFFFTTTLLPNGRVLVIGGSASPNGAEVYDPVANLWFSMPNTQNPQQRHAAAILPNGTVLFSGGVASSTVEYFDVGRKEQSIWRPVLTAATDPLVEGNSLVALGTGFTGQSEGSSGLGYMQSASNYPLVQLHRLDNDAVRWLPVDPVVEWSDTDFGSLPVSGFTPGPARVTVFTSGIPSDSRFVNVECPPPTITSNPVDQSICEGDSANFTVDGTGPCRVYQWRKDGSPLADAGPFSGTRTDALTITNATASEIGDYDAALELSCSSTPAFSTAATLAVNPALSPPVQVNLLSGPSTVCSTCVGGTINELHTGGGAVAYEWGYRTAPATPPITWLPGQTGATYVIDGADFPGPGTYYLVARLTPACGSPLVSSNEITVTVTPLAPTADEVQFFTVTSRDQENVLEWVTSAGFGNVRILFNEGVGCSFPTDPVGPADGVFDLPGAAGTHEVFAHNSPALANDIDYCYTVFSDKGGGTYSVGVSNRGRPMDTTLPVKWSFSTGVFSMTAPTVGWSGIIATSNDHVVHAMERGLAGGQWPAGWFPIRLNSPVQSRSPIVPVGVGGANPVVYLGAQDGNVYVVDADQGGNYGGFPWAPVSLGGLAGQAAPAGMFTAFGGSYDYLLVGTREGGVDNRFYALDPFTGAPIDFFDDSAGAGIGIINSMAVIDYANDLVVFASNKRSGGASTLWCLNLLPTPAPTFSLAWNRDFGDIDSSPVLAGGRVYVVGGLNNGRLYSVDAVSGGFYALIIGDGQAKGFVFPDWRNPGDIYFAGDDYVWAMHDNGSNFTNKFAGGITLAGGVVPTSPVVFIPGSHYLYVGGSDGKLYEVDVSGASPVIKSIVLGDGLATVGAPSLDWQNNLIHVGTEAGVFYAVEVPFP